MKPKQPKKKQSWNDKSYNDFSNSVLTIYRFLPIQKVYLTDWDNSFIEWLSQDLGIEIFRRQIKHFKK